MGDISIVSILTRMLATATPLAIMGVGGLFGERAGSVTTVLTTHYLEEAEALCDRVGILKEGVKIFDGTVESLKAQTGENSFEDAFVKISAETIEG